MTTPQFNWYWTATDGRVYSGARNVLGEYI
jgi:hypothetical protein